MLTSDLPEGLHYITMNAGFLLGNDVQNVEKISFSFSNSSQGGEFNLLNVSREDYPSLMPVPFSITANDDKVTIIATITYLDPVTLLENTVSRSIDISNTAKKTTGSYITIGGCDGGDNYAITGYTPSASVIHDYSASYPVVPATGRYYVFYSNANCSTHRITKPIIFIDGYDPANSRGADEIYTKFINRPVNIGGTLYNLADKVRQDGYDIIVLNYDDGGDMIEKNGLLLGKLLTTIYTNFPTAQQCVVIGPSMGAIVAQYGLRWMEYNGYSNHCREFISFDGPHQGANVPIGLQKFIFYLTGGSILNTVASSAVQYRENCYC